MGRKARSRGRTLLDNLPRKPLAEEARDILDAAVERWNPVAVYGLFSGGHDSLCACWIASQHPKFTGCVHVNTGVGVERTRQFVRDTCKAFGWPLREMHPPTLKMPEQRKRPDIDYANLPAYEALVMHYGFPGPAMHGLVYTRLKERCVRQLVREAKHKQRDVVMLVTGVRKEESTRRMGNATAEDKVGSQLWVAPLLYWSSGDKHDFILENNLPRNPVVESLCMSGECLCGAFAKPGELEEIRILFPEAAAYIDDLQKKVAAAGRERKVWGDCSPETRRRGLPQTPHMGLCFSCEAKQGKAEDLKGSLLTVLDLDQPPEGNQSNG